MQQLAAAGQIKKFILPPNKSKCLRNNVIKIVQALCHILSDLSQTAAVVAGSVASLPLGKMYAYTQTGIHKMRHHDFSWLTAVL